MWEGGAKGWLSCMDVAPHLQPGCELGHLGGAARIESGHPDVALALLQLPLHLLEPLCEHQALLLLSGDLCLEPKPRILFGAQSTKRLGQLSLR